jgi:adenylosuccinate lyase
LVASWYDHEIEVQHETAGFVRALRELLPAESAPYLYLGLTSSDLMDTNAALLWTEIKVELDDASQRLLDALMAWTREPGQRMGRTHGRLAEPVLVGAPYIRAFRDLNDVRCDLNRHQIPGKMSGPVGGYNSALTPEVADAVAYNLDIPMDPNASQIVSRHYYRRVAADLIEMVSICETLATLHRLSAIQGVDTFAEQFHTQQMGSSVMAHKRNPIASERICGLARVARANFAALLETWSTGWWERDLTNSSVERTAWIDLIMLTDYVLRQTAQVCNTGSWRLDVPDDYQSPTDELIQRQLDGHDFEAAYRDIQSRASNA